MTMVTVRVTKPGNRLVYIKGNYIEAAGNSSADSFTVPTGGHPPRAALGRTEYTYALGKTQRASAENSMSICSTAALPTISVFSSPIAC
jgi:hypothetical protein